MICFSRNMKLFLLLMSIAFGRAQITTTKWDPVPTIEDELKGSYEIGNSKSELACSMEATKKNVNLWCFRDQECLLSSVIKVQSWNDAVLWNQTSVFECRTKLIGCVSGGQLYLVNEIMETETSCHKCKAGNVKEDLLAGYVQKSES